MSSFILNDTPITTDVAPGTLLLDFIRYHQHLVGTKIGCREGDCGACTVLVGEVKNEQLIYTTATSCLMAIGNAAGKHIVTIEGLNGEGLNAVQQAFADEGATQCGFCTPGFIVSLAGFCISDKAPVYDSAIDFMNGNICRCTGYKSIERAASRVNDLMQKRNGSHSLSFATENNIIPNYFLSIQQRLQQIARGQPMQATNGTPKKLLGGGTDLYVQQQDTMPADQITFLFDEPTLNGVTQEGNNCVLGAAVTAADIAASPIFLEHFPTLNKIIKLVSSTQIRNMATIAGNFVNASPIGDFTIFFLALDAQIVLVGGVENRMIPLRDFYTGYKKLNKEPHEFVEKIVFHLPTPQSYFNFEKVCKRTYLDIASVNTAIHLTVENNIVLEAGISAGGVGPVPLYLRASSEFLRGKAINENVITETLQIAQSEISPISDARGTTAYKRLLLNQLIKAHFLKVPEANQ